MSTIPAFATITSRYHSSPTHAHPAHMRQWRGPDGFTIEMLSLDLRHLFPSRDARDEVVEKYGAIEGGKQHLAKLEAYVRGKLA